MDRVAGMHRNPEGWFRRAPRQLDAVKIGHTIKPTPIHSPQVRVSIDIEDTDRGVLQQIITDGMKKPLVVTGRVGVSQQDDGPIVALVLLQEVLDPHGLVRQTVPPFSRVVDPAPHQIQTHHQDTLAHKRKRFGPFRWTVHPPQQRPRRL